MKAELCFRVTTPEALGARLEKLGVDAQTALSAGRVFVNQRRRTAHDWHQKLSPGDRVDVYPERRLEPLPPLVIQVRKGLVIANKPPELSTESDQSGHAGSLVERVAEALGVEPRRVHAPSRLDVGVSGLVLLTITPEARKHVLRLQSAHRIERRYLGISSASLPGAAALGGVNELKELSGRWNRPVPDARGQLRASETAFRVLARAPDAEFLELLPVSGRFHQLRQHAALAGVPLWGDRRYGGPTRFSSDSGAVHELRRIALHADRLDLVDEQQEALRVQIPLPKALAELWAALGGQLPTNLRR